MVFEGVPWMVEDGVHSVEVGRLLAYAATGAGEGVIGAADCKVVASAIPDGNVHIQSGGIVALNRFPGGGQQSYIMRNVGDTVVALDPQGSSGGRYDLVAVIVEDPEYAGQPAPVDPATGPYVRAVVYKNVSATARTLAEVDPDQTGYVLARVHFDASDGTVTTADITDLREMVNPRTKTVEEIALETASVTAPQAAFGLWPSNAHWDVFIPVWATRLLLVGQVDSVRLMDIGAEGGWCYGFLRAELGTLVTPNIEWIVDAPAGIAGWANTQCKALAEVAVPPELRGTTQTLRLMTQFWDQHDLTPTTVNGSLSTARVVFMESVV